MKPHTIRLHPGDDLRKSIDGYSLSHSIQAGCIIACVGSLTIVELRMAGAASTKSFRGTFEIVSLVGTIERGNSHLHLAISDVDGHVFGGHVKQGCIIETTAEIVIGEIKNTIFTRSLDTSTGYEELTVTTK